MEQQEENFQPDDIAACRNRFEAAMAILEEEEAPAPPPPPPAPMAEPILGPFTVYFDFDDAELTADARPALAAVIEAAESYAAPRGSNSGYTPRPGTRQRRETRKRMT